MLSSLSELVAPPTDGEPTGGVAAGAALVGATVS